MAESRVPLLQAGSVNAPGLPPGVASLEISGRPPMRGDAVEAMEAPSGLWRPTALSPGFVAGWTAAALAINVECIYGGLLSIGDQYMSNSDNVLDSVSTQGGGGGGVQRG